MTFFPSSFIILQMKTTSELRKALPLWALLEGEKKYFNFSSDFRAKKSLFETWTEKRFLNRLEQTCVLHQYFAKLGREVLNR